MVEDLFRTLSNWGRWGPEDQLGTLNFITPGQRMRAVALVRDGTTVSCALPVSFSREPSGASASDEGVVMRPFRFVTASGEGEWGSGDRRESAAEVFLLPTHGAMMTHLDAPSHSMRRGTIYNGHSAKRITTRGGAAVGAVTQAAGGIVSRGVLLDLERVRGVGWWREPGASATRRDLEAAEEAAGVVVGTGDVVLVRTGLRSEVRWGPPRFSSCPGLAPDCLLWLHAREVAVLGTDGIADVLPMQYPDIGLPIHAIGMWAMGLWLIDNCDLERLTDVCAEHGRCMFMFVLAPLLLEGATGSLANPIAMF